MRYPKGPARQVPPDEVGSGLSARLVRRGPDVCILAVGKLVEAAEEAARLLHLQGIGATVWDVRVVKPLDPHMIADAAGAPLVVTAEDGVRVGGAGSAIADAIGQAAADGRAGRRPGWSCSACPTSYLAQGAAGPDPRRPRPRRTGDRGVGPRRPGSGPGRPRPLS